LNIQVNIAVQSNRAHIALQILKALEKQTLLPTSVVLILQGFQYQYSSTLPLTIVTNETNKGAAQRFIYLGEGINLIIDDDFIPKDTYIQTAIEGHLRHPNALCSFWSLKYLNNPNYLLSWEDMPSWNNYADDIKCNRIGLGLSIFDSTKIDERLFDFTFPNYNDMQVAVNAGIYGVELWKIAHSENIALHIGDEDVQSNALWKRQNKNIELLQSLQNIIYEKQN
jgi:hypothetical protein